MTLKCGFKHTKSFVDMSIVTGQSHTNRHASVNRKSPKKKKNTSICEELWATNEY